MPCRSAALLADERIAPCVDDATGACMADYESLLKSIRFAPGPMPGCSRSRARRCVQDVIYHLETYDVTTIRAGTPMFLLARKIKAMGVKMVLSGEGADEELGGYLYFHKVCLTF